MTTVAIYTRLSSDPSGEQTATHRQQAACAAYAELRGWEVVRVFEDLDLSAYRTGVVRPAYEEMLLAIQAKRIDGVLAWKLDRLVRRSAEFERLWGACERSGVFLTSAMEPIDTSTDLGLALVRVLVAFASLESATSGARLRAKFQERAERLVPHSTAAAYGIKKGWRKLDPAQVKMIHEAVDRVLAGEAVRKIVIDWNARGIPSSKGKQWSHVALRSLLLQPRLAGLVSHNGEIMGRGSFPTIIDEATHQRLRDLLLDPSRRTVRGGTTPHLLSGVLRCSYCGESLYPTVQVRDHKEYFICPPPPKGCTRISIRMARATPAVLDALFDRLHSKGYGGHNGMEWSSVQPVVLDRAFDGLGVSLRELAADYYVRQEITRAQFLDMRDGLFAAVEEGLGKNMARPASLRAVHNMTQLRRRWDEIGLDEQRAILRSEIASVTIHPAAKHGRVFDPARVEVIWLDTLKAHRRSASWLSTAEAATQLGVSRRSVMRLIADGTLHGEKLGPSWMLRRHDVDEHQRERRTQSMHR